MRAKLKSKPLVFISYVHEDEAVAVRLRDWMAEALLDGLEFFIAADRASIPLGKEWPRQIADALRKCELALLVITANSAERKWIYFEAGAAFARNVPVIPICCLGFKKADLAPPLCFLQAVELPDRSEARELVASLATVCALRPSRRPPPLRLPDTIAKSTPIPPQDLGAGALLETAAAASRREYAREIQAWISRLIGAPGSGTNGWQQARAFVEAKLLEARQSLERSQHEQREFIEEAQKAGGRESAARGFALIGLSDMIRDLETRTQILETVRSELIAGEGGRKRKRLREQRIAEVLAAV